jgi:hypothetical protein
MGKPQNGRYRFAILAALRNGVVIDDVIRPKCACPRGRQYKNHFLNMRRLASASEALKLNYASVLVAKMCAFPAETHSSLPPANRPASVLDVDLIGHGVQFLLALFRRVGELTIRPLP